jgi:hypothetical protein
VLGAVLPGRARPSMPKGNALLASRETLSSPPPATLTHLTGPSWWSRSTTLGGPYCLTPGTDTEPGVPGPGGPAAPPTQGFAGRPVASLQGPERAWRSSGVPASPDLSPSPCVPVSPRVPGVPSSTGDPSCTGGLSGGCGSSAAACPSPRGLVLAGGGLALAVRRARAGPAAPGRAGRPGRWGRRAG